MCIEKWAVWITKVDRDGCASIIRWDTHVSPSPLVWMRAYMEQLAIIFCVFFTMLQVQEVIIIAVWVLSPEFPHKYSTISSDINTSTAFLSERLPKTKFIRNDAKPYSTHSAVDASLTVS